MAKRLFYFCCVLFIFSATCKSQEIGKIYSKAEAKVKFGAVVDSVIFSVTDLKKILDGTEKYAMFKISKGKVVILGDKRKVLYPKDAKVDSSEAFCYLSKSKLLELLTLSDSKASVKTNTVSFEMHKLYFSISNDTSTLEDVLVCPPFCD
jgi:hypothetical protein